MSDELVSVIIPTWNRAWCLEHAVNSALTQTHSDVEVLVVDDGSTDGTSELVSKMMARDSRVRYLPQRNSGVATARNNGIANARGNYLGFLDSDDVWEPWKLELQVACLKKRPNLGMVWTDMTAVDPEGRVVDRYHLRIMYAAYRHFKGRSIFPRQKDIREVAPSVAKYVPGAKLSEGNIFSQMITGNLVHTSTVLLTRERLQRVEKFNEEFTPNGEDYDFHLRTCREGDVGFINVSSIRYQIGMPDQLTNRSYSIGLSRNFLRTIEPIIAKERDRIHLPEPLVRSTLAYGYRWLGTELLVSGSSEDARTALQTSLKWEWSPVTAALVGASWLPASGVQLLRRLSSPFIRTLAAWRERPSAKCSI